MPQFTVSCKRANAFPWLQGARRTQLFWCTLSVKTIKETMGRLFQLLVGFHRQAANAGEHWEQNERRPDLFNRIYFPCSEKLQPTCCRSYLTPSWLSRLRLSPAARHILDTHGIDPKLATPTGPRGLITKEWVWMNWLLSFTRSDQLHLYTFFYADMTSRCQLRMTTHTPLQELLCNWPRKSNPQTTMGMNYAFKVLH